MAKREKIKAYESEISKLKSLLPNISKEQKRLDMRINRAYGKSFFDKADKGLITRGDGSLGTSWETKKDTYWSK